MLFPSDSSQEQGLKQMNRLSEQSPRVQSFDIASQVMDQVYRRSKRPSGRRTAILSRIRTASALPAAAVFCLLFASVTAYAAFQYLEFRDSSGAVVMDTAIAPLQDAEDTAFSEAFWAYEEEARSRLKPGEYAAYYVKDDSYADRGVRFTYHADKKKRLADLQAAVLHTGAPSIGGTVHWPEGYAFEYGYVSPVDNPGYTDAGNLAALGTELKQEAEASGETKGVFLQTLDWDTAGSTVIRYSNGADFITLTVERLQPDHAKTTVMQNGQDKAEKLSIAGQEVFYIRSDEAEASLKAGRNRLGWLDEQQQLWYYLADNEGSPLGRDDLVNIAQGLITAAE